MLCVSVCEWVNEWVCVCVYVHVCVCIPQSVNKMYSLSYVCNFNLYLAKQQSIKSSYNREKHAAHTRWNTATIWSENVLYSHCGSVSFHLCIRDTVPVYEFNIRTWPQSLLTPPFIVWFYFFQFFVIFYSMPLHLRTDWHRN